MSGKKICKQCGKEKELIEFHKDSEKKFGVKNVCKECRKTGRIKMSDNRLALHKSINSSIYNAIKFKREFTWSESLGYTIDELKEHIENNFQKGMTWKNYGKKWKISRIIKPKEYGNTKLHQEIKKCWSIKNALPLWKNEYINADLKIIEDYSLYDILPIGYKIIDKK